MIRTIVRTLFWIAILAYTWYALSAVADSAAAAMPASIGAAIILTALAIALSRRPTSR